MANNKKARDLKPGDLFACCSAWARYSASATIVVSSSPVTYLESRRLAEKICDVVLYRAALHD